MMKNIEMSLEIQNSLFYTLIITLIGRIILINLYLKKLFCLFSLYDEKWDNLR